MTVRASWHFVCAMPEFLFQMYKTCIYGVYALCVVWDFITQTLFKESSDSQTVVDLDTSCKDKKRRRCRCAVTGKSD